MPLGRPYVRVFHSKLSDVVREFARQNEMIVKSGTLRYDEWAMRVTLTFSIQQSDQEMAAAKKKEWYVHCVFFNLAPDDFGETVVMDGEEFTITGLNLKSKRNAVELRRVRDGKLYRSSPDAVRRAFRLAQNRVTPSDVEESA